MFDFVWLLWMLVCSDDVGMAISELFRSGSVSCVSGASSLSELLLELCGHRCLC